jgi:hypothetical protein
MIRRTGTVFALVMSIVSVGQVSGGSLDAASIEDKPAVVLIDFDLLASLSEAPIETELLFGGTGEVRLIPSGVNEYRSSGVRSITGKLSDGGSFVIADGPGGTQGALWTTSGTWEVTGDGETDSMGRLVLDAMRVNGPLADCSDALVPAPASRPHDPGLIGSLDRGIADPEDIVRVLVAFDPFAASLVGDIDVYAAALVDSANQAYVNSGVNPMRLELAAAVLTHAATTTDGVTLVLQMTDRYDGNHDELHTLRDAYDADLVAMIVDFPSFCGVGWLSPEEDQYSFSVSDIARSAT